MPGARVSGFAHNYNMFFACPQLYKLINRSCPRVDHEIWCVHVPWMWTYNIWIHESFAQGPWMGKILFVSLCWFMCPECELLFLGKSMPWTDQSYNWTWKLLSFMCPEPPNVNLWVHESFVHRPWTDLNLSLNATIWEVLSFTCPEWELQWIHESFVQGPWMHCNPKLPIDIALLNSCALNVNIRFGDIHETCKCQSLQV